MCVAGVLTVNHLSLPGFTEEVDETEIDVRGGGDPFVVGWGKAGRVVEPGPHYCAGAEGEEQGGRLLGNCFGRCGWKGVGLGTAPQIYYQGVESAGAGEDCQV